MQPSRGTEKMRDEKQTMTNQTLDIKHTMHKQKRTATEDRLGTVHKKKNNNKKYWWCVYVCGGVGAAGGGGVGLGFGEGVNQFY